MFPRERRKTRSISRSSASSEQNSHDSNTPDSSVSQSGQDKRVSASRPPQTGHELGTFRVIAS
jgi:hypothetical protein